MSRLLWRSSVRHLLAHPWQVGLSILGIALGVAVVVSVDLANESARRAFMGFAESLAGRATHRIVGGPSGLPEETYARLRLSGVRAVAPVIDRDVSAVDVPGRTFHLLGIDPFAEAPFRSFVTAESASGARPLATLLTRPATALIAQATAAQLGLRPGASLVIRAGARRHRVELVGGVSAPREIKWLRVTPPPVSGFIHKLSVGATATIDGRSPKRRAYHRPG